ncbi:hypothetical protein [Dokdonella sp.]|uniref:hypothetical protein n=1 Tax=Dokdonella sp. TaxID=2291710 RepID=UPI002F40097E
MSARFSLPRIALLVVVALAGACSGVRPQVEHAPGDVRIERVDREFDIPAGVTRIAITNLTGEINLRSRDEREVGIHAVVQRMPPGHAHARFRTRRDGDTFAIEVGFDGDAAGRVDVAAYLPGDLAVALTTRDGRIAAKRRAGPIEATTESGPIFASSRDRLRLASRSGTIRAVAIGARWHGDSTVETDTGQVVLMVPTFGDVVLDAASGGKVSTDFGLTVRTDAGGLHTARARFGLATSPLHVRSRTGELVLEQLVLLGDDTEIPEDDD